MNKFIGQKLITKKWLTQTQKITAVNLWTIFESQDVARSVEDREKINQVKNELQNAAKHFVAA